VDTYMWRAEPVLNGLMDGVAGALVVLFVVLSIVPLAFKGVAQKVLMLGIVVWFVAAAAMMRY